MSARFPLGSLRVTALPLVAFLFLAAACHAPTTSSRTTKAPAADGAHASTATLAGIVREIDGRTLESAVVELRRTAPGAGDARDRGAHDALGRDARDALGHDAHDALGRDASESHGRSAATLELARDGRFRADELAPGAWELAVRSPGRAEFTTTLELARGEDRTLTLDLPRGLALAGRVVDAHGAPVAGVRIGAVRAGGVPIAWSVSTDDDGRFRLVGFERGECWLHVESLAKRASSEGLVTMSDFEWRVRAGREDLELVQPIQRTLVVRVVDESGAPATNARLVVTGLRGCVTGRVLELDAQGRARITQPEGCTVSFEALRTGDDAPLEPATATDVRVEERELVLVLPGPRTGR